MKLREYQRKSVNKTFFHFSEGRTRVCLVIPTGGGKSVCAGEMVRRARFADARVLAICHRRELVEQLIGHFGTEAAAICPGFDRKPDAPIQVATIQTLLASGERPHADLLIADECHHLASGGEWQALAEDYAGVRTVGLTATPERGDGRPLGDMFDALVVGAQYEELMKDGHILGCRVFQATRVMGSNELAKSPLEAIKRHAEGQMFVFCKNVAHAYETCAELNSNGYKSAVIEGQTKTEDRERDLELFRNGELDAICNVYTMTEGVDVPAATTCVIARTVGHPSTYLQMVGRVLRPAPGKEEAVLIDLSGASLVHGFPTENRAYSLNGKGIVKEKSESITVCCFCGYTYISQRGPCPSCGETMAAEETTKPKVNIRFYDDELREVYAGRNTPALAKNRELQRLMDLAGQWGYDFGFVVKEYKKLFNEPLPVWRVSLTVRQGWYNQLVQRAAENKWKKTYALARYKTAFGCWPEWR